MLSKKIVIVTDREFKFGSIFPVGVHVYCWNHLEQDLYWYLKHNGNCNAEQINYFVNSFKALLEGCTTEVEFDREWDQLRETKKFACNEKVIKYFTKNLIPAVKAHAAIWVLKEAGVQNPTNGITNNASESMNAVLHRLQQWKHVPLDVIVVSLYHLCTFYYREIQRSLHQCGEWCVKDQFDHYKRDPSLLPNLEVGLDPKSIVDKVCIDIHAKPESTNVQSSAFGNTPKSQATASTQIGLAHLAIRDHRVKLVGSGAWVVLENDGVTPCAVTLFPKETCSCKSIKTCYHITACRLLIGLCPNEKGKANVSELQRKQRIQKERPAGRKQPRRKDFQRTDCQEHTTRKRKLSGNYYAI